MDKEIEKYFIYYINCNHRDDKDRNIKDILSNEGFSEREYLRIEADYIKENGHLGCARSHIKAIEKFIRSEYDCAVIIEDDLGWDLMGLMRYEFIERALENKCWDVFILSGATSNQFKTENINSDIIRVKGVSTTAFYLLRRNFCKRILDVYYESERFLSRNPDLACEYAIDQNWKKLQRHHNFYAFKSTYINWGSGYFPGYQKEFFSDIENTDLPDRRW